MNWVLAKPWISLYVVLHLGGFVPDLPCFVVPALPCVVVSVDYVVAVVLAFASAVGLVVVIIVVTI